MAPPTHASALTGDFLGVPPSPKRPREDEQPQVMRRMAQSRAWPWPCSNVTIDIRSAVVSLRLHRQRNRGASALFTSQNLLTGCSVEPCSTPLSHHGTERACTACDSVVVMPRVTYASVSLCRIDRSQHLQQIKGYPHISSQKLSSDLRRSVGV
eukprot:scaffold10898_cov128-Isochrysis_galbana.AAC.3